MKNILAIAVATALIAPAAAMADTTLYGKLQATVGSVENTTAGVSVSETIVESHNSRIGIKGSTELDAGMSATYGMEYDLELDEKGTLGSNRNKFVGVKGGFGEVRVGVHDTPAKLATSGLDAFADNKYADMSAIIASDGQRVNNAVAYINKFGPVGFAAAHSTDMGDDDVDTGAAATATAAADPHDDTAANTLMANYSTGPFYGALGYTAIDDAAETTQMNIGVGYKAEAGHFANVVYETVAKDGTAAADDSTNTYVAGGVKSGAMTFKAAYGIGDTDGKAEEKLTSVGVDYKLGKKTNAFVQWSENTNKDRAATEAAGKDTTATAVGLVTEF